jgi:hypothetical protein
MVAENKPSGRTAPIREPYQIDDESAQSSTAPSAQRSFELTRQAPVEMPKSEAAKPSPTPSSPDSNSLPIQRRVIGQANPPTSSTPNNALPDSRGFTDDATQTEIHIDQDSADRSKIQGQQTMPQRIVNPFATGTTTPTPPMATIPKSGPTTNEVTSTADLSASVYTKTPFNAFTSKASAPNTSPVRPEQATPPEVRPVPAPATSPNSTLSPVVPRASNETPIDSKPASQNMPKTPALSSTTSPGPSPIAPAVTPSKSGNELPAALLQTQGSYAPGSMRSVPSLNSTLPKSSTLATTPPASTTTTALPPVPAPTTKPPSAPSIGGGGSLQLSK